MRILIINGPNLNFLGKREPALYGSETLWDIENSLKQKFPSLKLEFLQSNIEGELVTFVQQGMSGTIDGIVINPGAYSHYSLALRDAIGMLKIPVVEVHLTNIHAREGFRKHSVTAEVCKGVVAGFGAAGYELALQAIVDLLKR